MVLETARLGSTLPVVLTGMLGRERETRELRAIIRDPAVRMVTITGPGGVGKTRLAVAVASGITEDLDVVFVSLSTIRDPERIAPAIGRALGLNLEPGAEGEAMLLPALGERQTILVLDNLEQVSGATPVLSRLLDHITGLTILATSQVALDVAGEHRFPLAPLTVPDSSARDALASDAVALFLERARAVDPALPVNEETLATIAAICRRLDGLPLAIELAAARVNLLSPASMLQRLDDRFGMLSSQREDLDNRHRTLRAAIAWTYDLLDPVEQALLRRLAVFAGGVPLDGAEAVRTSTDDRSVAEVMESLVRRSILQPQTGKNGAKRYQMLESVREFGIDQLTRLGEEESARLAHAAWVTALAEQSESHLRGAQQVQWLERLGEESENIRLAIDRSLAQGYHEYLARVIAATWRFLGSRGWMNDARRWLIEALAPGAAVAPWYRARALVAAGHLSLLAHRDRAAGERYLEQALHLATAIGNRDAEMQASGGLGIFAYDAGDYDRASGLYKRSESLAREIGSLPDLAAAANNLGLVAWMKGEPEDALAHWEESARINAEMGDTLLEAQILTNLGAVQNGLGLLDQAKENLGRAIQILRALNDRTNLVPSLINYGDNALLRNDVGGARDSYLEGMTLGRQFNHEVFVSAATVGLSVVRLHEGDFAGSASLLLESLSLVGDNSEPMRMLEIIEALAGLGATAGEEVATAKLLAAAASLRGDSGTVAPVPGISNPLTLETSVRKSLGEERFNAAWKAGAAFDIEETKTQARIIARRIAGRQVREPKISWPEPPGSNQAPPYLLTPRELDILWLLATGKSTQDIATGLAISPRTVMTHIANLMAKMDVASRTAAVALAIRDGVIPTDG